MNEARARLEPRLCLPGGNQVAERRQVGIRLVRCQQPPQALAPLATAIYIVRIVDLAIGACWQLGSFASAGDGCLLGRQRQQTSAHKHTAHTVDDAD